jgi:outer membrane immunogenic protein
MKRVLLTGVSLLTVVVLAGAAGAADLGRQMGVPTRAPAAYVAPIYNWTGLYLGLNAGGGWGNSNWTDAATSSGDFDTSGALIGGTLGYNWQTGQVVFGVETDLAWSNIDGNTPAAFCAGCTTENNWLSTVRGRVGFAMDRVLPYITGGVAFGDIEAHVPGFSGDSSTEAGWTLGGGLEVALAANWTAKAEYLYVDLGSMSCSAANCAGLGSTEVEFQTHVLRGGLNYRF